ncbi:hypothetical protein [Sphingomonas faeni]|uniref:hypothetical protein n=1 Tax=Sphingomonas faeni TaxID=185950 RepID=UPI002788BAE2|nr:hypothetical protein [Sphingomonas faeni]MDQ0839306.1 hypothetical protein [Sphingomonas faeni]
MERQPVVQPRISSFEPSPVLVEQVLLPRSVEDAFARLTSWQSLPALIPVSPMLEPARGKRIDRPSEQGDMLIGRGHAGGVEQVYLVVSAVSHLLWTVVARPLGDDRTAEYQLTVAFSAAAGGQCLMVVQIVGAASEFIDQNGLRSRLDRIKSLLDGAANGPSRRPRRGTAFSRLVRPLWTKVEAYMRIVVGRHSPAAAATG